MKYENISNKIWGVVIWGIIQYLSSSSRKFLCVHQTPANISKGFTSISKEIWTGSLEEASACTWNLSQACVYLEIPSQVLKETCFLPCLSILNLTNGTDEEMFTVNMVPDTSYSTQPERTISYSKTVCISVRSLVWYGVCVFVCVQLCGISGCRGVMGNSSTLAVIHSLQQEQGKI